VQNPYIIGESVYLRPIEIEDAARYATWLNDPEVRPGVGRTTLLSRLNEEEIIHSMHQKSNQQILAIVEKEKDTHIGGTGVHSIDSVSRSCSFGIFIGDRERWSRGYATEATRLVQEHVFDALNLNRIQLNVFSFNTRAIGL
jgi:RimJ/RimL family protein N-acetyltransferase